MQVVIKTSTELEVPFPIDSNVYLNFLPLNASGYVYFQVYVFPSSAGKVVSPMVVEPIAL
ncbi:MAG: hypothetical protein ACFFG0_33755 [Candidatus Thorarchaeota archaeon]